MKAWILIAAIISSSCAARTVYVIEPLPLPDRPEYIKIQSESLECLADDIYVDLVRSVMQRDAHIETLENIIRTTRGK